MNTEITWLHLSDLHFRISQKWSQDVVLNSLIQDVYKRHSAAKRPDFIFITGDIAYSGQAEEYSLADEFIKKLQEATEVTSDRLFLVPGNHDINRQMEEDAFFGAHQRLTDTLEVDRFLASEQRRKTLFKRQAAYRAFANKIAPPDNEGYTDFSYTHVKSALFGPITVRVLLIDSSWLADGGVSDRGGLLIGERQVIDADPPEKSNALKIALVHHPFSWLRDFEQAPIETLLLQRVHVLLRGHVHSEDQKTIESLGLRMNIFTAGASFETRTAENSYARGSLELSTGLGVTVTHRYQQASHDWTTLEPLHWNVLDQNTGIGLQEAITDIGKSIYEFQYYTAALVSEKETNVPQIVGDRILFMNFGIEDARALNPIGPLVKQLRNHLYWKRAWQVDNWERRCQEIATTIEIELRKIGNRSVEIKQQLVEQERKCKHIADAILLASPVVTATPIIEELRALAREKEWQQVLQRIEHWQTEATLSDDEAIELLRGRIEALLGLNRPDEALCFGEQLIADKRHQPKDLSLVAACHYTKHDYPTAGMYLHKALDGGVEIGSVRSIAVAIAGQTGDYVLVKRVRNG